MGLGATGTDLVEQSIRVITTISDDVATFETMQQMRCCAQIMGLSRRQNEPHREPLLVNHGVDLRAQSSTRTADGVILAPFFPPAAC